MSNKSKLIVSLIGFLFTALGSVLSATCWHSFLTYTPPTATDFTAIEGTIKSAEEKGSRNDAYLEIYLNENDIRYRVSINHYEKYFDSDSFFANIQANDSIVLEVNREQLKNPIRPRDTYPTIFIAGASNATDSYLQTKDVISWSKMNNKGALFVGILISMITPMVAVSSIAAVRAPEKSNFLFVRNKPI